MGTSIFHKCPTFSWVLFANYSHIFLEPWFQKSNCLLFVSCQNFCVHFYPLFHNIIIVLFNTKNTIFSIFISNIIKKTQFVYLKYSIKYAIKCLSEYYYIFWNHGSKILIYLITTEYAFDLYAFIYISISSRTKFHIHYIRVQHTNTQRTFLNAKRSCVPRTL